MINCDVTRRALTLGAADTTTGWYVQTFAETTIKAILDFQGAPNPSAHAQGYYAVYPCTAYVPGTIETGDEIIHAGTYYTVYKAPVYIADQFQHWICRLEKKLGIVDRPSTSGTWASTQKDPRERTRTWLTAYMSNAAILKDNNSTQASWISQFAFPDYPIDLVLLPTGKDVDLVISVEFLGEESLNHAQTKTPYAYNSTVRIYFQAIDKTGVTAVNLIDKAVQEFKKEIIAHGFIAGSVRQIGKVTDYPQKLSTSQKLYGQYIDITYKRANEEFTATYPVLSYSSDFIYDGERVAGAIEGTWDITGHLGGSTITIGSTNNDYLTLNISAYVADAYVHNGTPLAMSPAIFTKIRWRYRTSGNATAKIILEDSGGHTQTVLSETASTSWTVGSVTISFGDADTLSYIRLYACDGAGAVDYDFIQIYKSNYILPNVVELEPPAMVEDALIQIPGMSGEVTQIMGNKLMEITMVCDLDMEPSGLSWKLPQSGTPKTTYNNIDVLLDNCMEGGQTNAQGSHPWEWLDLGSPTIQMKARLVEMRPSYKGDSSLVTLKFREYRLGGANGVESITERYMLNM